VQTADKRTHAGIIDVRSLSPIDWGQHRAVGATDRSRHIVEEGPKTGGVGAEFGAGIAERRDNVADLARGRSRCARALYAVLENATGTIPQRIYAAREMQC